MNNDKIVGRFVLFCDYAFQTIDGKLSLIGEFDRILSKSDKPVLHNGYVVASFDGIPNTEYSLRIEMSSKEDEKVLPDKVLSIKTGSTGRANVLMNLVNVVFAKRGLYQVIFFDEAGGQLLKTSLVVTNPPQKMNA